jgi:hypothetical protein
MMPDQPWKDKNGINANDTDTAGVPPSTGDSDVPEFMDRFQKSRPILYVRANLGGIGVTTAPGGGIPQYSAALFGPYTRKDPTPDDANNVNDFPGDFVFRTVDPPNELATDYKTWDDYLRNPAIPFSGTPSPTNLPTARRKDSYLLLSAGPDNVFGTKDDIFFGQ